MELRTYSARELPRRVPLVILHLLTMYSAALQPLSGKLYQYYTSKVLLTIADIDIKVSLLIQNV